MGLTQKILLFTSALVVTLLVATLLFTTYEADRLAHATIESGLQETKEFWDNFQADRYKKLQMGIRVLANDPGFKALMAEKSDLEVRQATAFDTLQERGKDLGATFVIATDAAGIMIARSDDQAAKGDDLSKDPIVMKALEGEDASTVWRQKGRLNHAVATRMQIGSEKVGVLIAGYALDAALANQLHKLTRSEIAFVVQPKGQPSELSESSLGPKEDALKGMLGQINPAAGSTFEIELRGDRHIGVAVPLIAATGEPVGTVLALCSLNQEMASFRRFRNSLLVVSAIALALGLTAAYLMASRITGPVRHLVELVEKARDGSYSGAVGVATTDEIGTLARAFNSLLADLREKEQLVEFLREGMTMMKKGIGATATLGSEATTVGSAETSTLSAVPASARMEKGSLFAGRYEILGTLGKGGMGVVYRAQDRTLEEVVALKVLRPDVMQQDPQLLERFKMETRLARKITHRNVLRTHDLGEAEGTLYISMEYLEGVTLKDLVANKGALPPGVGLRIAKQACQGLEAAHLEGVVHRDIKPQNMLILPESGELKIMDFGIARTEKVPAGQAGLTSAGTVMGTPDYIPPEQAQGYPADFRSDIYSLGVVFFEIFTGRLPFTGKTAMDMVIAQIQQAPPAPRSVNPRVPEDVEAIILRCLDKNPASRYQKVGDILRDLTEASSRLEAA